MIKIVLKNSNEFVLIDKEDFKLVSKYIWYLAKRGTNNYAITGSGNTKILMHRLILNIKDKSVHVDHINHNGLDNRKKNLRLCSPQQNRFNSTKRKNTSSKYKGVYWNKEKNKWQVTVKTLDGKTKSLGRYEDEKVAAEVYNKYVLTLYKDFAKLNDINYES